jgi:hypothetical protein
LLGLRLPKPRRKKGGWGEKRVPRRSLEVRSFTEKKGSREKKGFHEKFGGTGHDTELDLLKKVDT